MARRIPPSAGGILSYFTRHPTLANLLVLFICAVGLAAMPNIRAQYFPDVVNETISVSVEWENASADDIDSAIIQLLEPALLAVPGVETTQATSTEGSGTIKLEFQANWDMPRATTDVQNAVDSITDFPEEAEEPQVDWSVRWDGVITAVVTGSAAHEQLVRYADEMVARLFAAGVTRTSVSGVVAPQIRVEVPSMHLIANDLTMAEIASAIGAEVDARPAGDVAGVSTRVRAGRVKREPEEIETVVLRSREDGSKLTVGDVAVVSRLGTEREIANYVGDNFAVDIRVQRSVDGDAIHIQRQTEAVAEALSATLPYGVEVLLVRARADHISSRLNTLLNNGLMGLALVVCVLFLFLNARTALWVAAGIPVAMFAAISLMYVGGLTLNMISLFGLIITLGIVVDDAIVVGEHADFRARRYGEPGAVAAERAAHRMAMPVTAAALTTLIAFCGLLVIDGRFGALIQDIPLTVIAVLVASLVECFLILPNHMSHALAAQAKEHWYDWPSRQVNRGFAIFRDRVFRPFMAWVIFARYVVLAALVVVLASQASLWIRGDVNWRFFNAPERGYVTGNFAMIEGASRADTLDMMREMRRAAERTAEKLEERHGRNPIAYMSTTVGGTHWPGLRGIGDRDIDLLGGIAIELIDAEERPYSSFAFIAEVQRELEKLPLTEIVAFRGQRSGPGGDALSVHFSNAETARLKSASLALQDALAVYPEVSGLQDSLAFDKEELVLELTAQGKALGFNIDDLGRSLRNRLAGVEAATYPDGPRSADVRVELPASELTADFLERTHMRSPTGDYVPLADLVSVEHRTGFSSVRRENGVRVVSVSGDVSEDDPERAAFIERNLRETILPELASIHQVEWEIAGQSEQQKKFMQGALLGFALCMAGIYVVLAWVFASWTRPLVIMAIIPFGLVGTIFGHWMWDVPLSMFTVVGLLGMTGIIINDSIVLITTIDEYAENRGVVPSIIDGTADRLRPVLLTTLTTVLGMMPLLFEQSQQAQFLKPTVITLVYGLGFGMFLVLLIVPSLVAIQHDLAGSLTSARRAFLARLPVLRFGFWSMFAVLSIWCAVTLGWFYWQGAMMTPLEHLPGLNGIPVSALKATGLFIAGALALSVISFVVLAVATKPRANHRS